MTLPDAIEHFLSKAGAEETTPFGPAVLVYKVGEKMFVLTVPDEFPARINLKCDPERALLLRDEHETIIRGYHMNKRHWNTLILDGSLPVNLVRELIDHSYALSLPRCRNRAYLTMPSSRQSFAPRCSGVAGGKTYQFSA